MELPTTWHEALQSGIKAERRRHNGVLKAYLENRKADMGWVADRFLAQQRLTCPMSWTTTHADGTVTDAHEERMKK